MIVQRKTKASLPRNPQQAGVEGFELSGSCSAMILRGTRESHNRTVLCERETLAAAGGLGQRLQDGVHLLRDGHQHKLELLPGRHQSGPLIAQMLQRGGNVNFPCALVHATQHQVEQNVGAASTYLLCTTIGHERPRYDLFTLRLKSSSALADVGTPPCGQDRKWNWVTVRVSPRAQADSPFSCSRHSATSTTAPCSHTICQKWASVDCIGPWAATWFSTTREWSYGNGAPGRFSGAHCACSAASRALGSASYRHSASHSRCKRPLLRRWSSMYDSTMWPVEMSMFVSAGSSLQEDVLDRDDGGRASASFVSAVMRPPGESEPAGPVFPPAIRARHRS
uniref:Uncharacterized protein n=1 Tax=Anopheles coluzzii TaxID=1518534 RepID=A0A8W7PFC2_ANOCL